MDQHSSYGTCNNAISRSVKQQQEITETHGRIQNITMLAYNNNSNNHESSIPTVIAETGGNTFSIATSNASEHSTSISNQNRNVGTVIKEKSGKNLKQQLPRKPPPTIETFWPTILQEVQTAVIDSKHQSLPLARIKKIMKLDENAKMIAAEAPTLFAKACEFFIQELTMRAWIHTDESKRRTLQRSDIAQAIANYDQFDFLIDIVPREDIKPHRRHHNDNINHNASAASNSTMSNVTGEILNVTGLPVDNISAVATAQPTTTTISASINQAQPTQMLTTATTTNHPPQLQIIQQTSQPQQHLQYFITLPGQQTGQAQIVQQLQMQHQQQHLNNGISASTPLTAASLNLVAQQPQQLILTAANSSQAASLVQHQHQTALLQNLAQQQQQAQQPQQQVQLVQQVMLTPSGEITNVPIAINANQLNLLRLQMQQQPQQQQQQQQLIIPTHLLTAQQLLQLQAHTQNSNQVNTGTTAHIVTHQQQQNSQTPTTPSNIYINANTAIPNQTTSAAASMVSTDRNMGSTFRNNC